ncbi:MAG: tetratricopeptide repeat protein [bacterium]
MRYLKHKHFLIIVSIICVVILAYLPKTWSLEPAQEAEYEKGKKLLCEGKLDEALSIFTKLSKDNPSDLRLKLGFIDTTTEQARVFKEKNNPVWKTKIYEAFGDLKRLFPSNKTSPEIFLSFAKCYWVNNRLEKADTSLRKAFYYNPGYMEAYIFQGTMYLEEGKALKKIISPVPTDTLDRDHDKFEKYCSKAKESFESALGLSSENNAETTAMIHLRLGDTYQYLYNNKEDAQKEWNKAVSFAPDCMWAKEAKEKLNK